MKTINTPREELICGAIDRAEDIARSLESVDLMYELQRIRHDAERMEAKLVSRKSEAAKPECVAIAGNGESLQKTRIEEFLSSAEGRAAVDKSIAEAQADIAGLNRARAVTWEQMNTPMGVRTQPERVALSDSEIRAVWDGMHWSTATATQFAHAILAAQASTQPVIAEAARDDVDALAQEIRRIDGNHRMGAGALAEALMPFIDSIAAVKRDDVAGDARPEDHILAALMNQHMVLCPTCGNKRCPHANDPDNYACTNSNEPGQLGSAYPDMLSSKDAQ